MEEKRSEEEKRSKVGKRKKVERKDSLLQMEKSDMDQCKKG